MSQVNPCQGTAMPDATASPFWCLTNLDAGHSNPGVIAHVVAGLLNPALTVPKLEAIADDHPELAERLKKLMDEVVAGTDIRPETSPQLTTLITPEEAKQIQQRLAKLWPGGTLTLVKRDKGSRVGRNGFPPTA